MPAPEQQRNQAGHIHSLCGGYGRRRHICQRPERGTEQTWRHTWQQGACSCSRLGANWVWQFTSNALC